MAGFRRKPKKIPFRNRGLPKYPRQHYETRKQNPRNDMKTLLKSFLPFTLLLIAIVAGVAYSDSLAEQRSNDFVAKTLEATATSEAPPAQPVLVSENTPSVTEAWAEVNQ